MSYKKWITRTLVFWFCDSPDVDGSSIDCLDVDADSVVLCSRDVPEVPISGVDGWDLFKSNKSINEKLTFWGAGD